MGKSGSAARPPLEILLHREEVQVATKLTLVSVRIAKACKIRIAVESSAKRHVLGCVKLSLSTAKNHAT